MFPVSFDVYHIQPNIHLLCLVAKHVTIFCMHACCACVLVMCNAMSQIFLVL